MDADNEDVILVNECLDGNGKVYEQIVEKYYKVVYRLTAKFVKNADDAEEITQSVFVKAYENLRSYNPKYKFFSWLYRIAVNEAINFKKKGSYTEQLEIEPNSVSPEPIAQLEASQLSADIHNALLELDLIYRIPIVMQHFMGYSYKELSFVLDVPEKTVKSRLFTGRQLLRDKLIKYKVILND
jgi:RNA polymerase sigma-70 factor (ECF subfamily)